MSDDTELPEQIEELLAGGVNPDEISSHLSDVGDEIEKITAETRTGNMVYAQSHVLEKAANLLRELHDEADEYGQREAEMIAIAIILSREADKEVT